MPMTNARQAISIHEATLADVPVLAEAHVVTWRETYRGLLPDDYLDGLAAVEREPLWRRAIERTDAERCVFVATDSASTIVGFASGGPHLGTLGYAGEVYTLYLRREYQGRGLGRDLFRTVAGRLHAQGLTSLALWVLATNIGARGFYEALGGRFVREQAIVFDGVPLREAGYGWRGDPLAGALRRKERHGE